MFMYCTGCIAVFNRRQWVGGLKDGRFLVAYYVQFQDRQNKENLLAKSVCSILCVSLKSTNIRSDEHYF